MELNMNYANNRSFAHLIGLSAATFTSIASAQDSAARDAAMTKCVNQAHRAFPESGVSQDMQGSDAYKACMASAGLQSSVVEIK
jgi:hypothetical protein